MPQRPAIIKLIFMKMHSFFAFFLLPAFVFCQNYPKTEVEASFNYRYIGNTIDLGIARNWRVVTLRAGLNARLWNGHYLNDHGLTDVRQRGVADKFPQYIGLNLGTEFHVRHSKLESFSPYFGLDADFSYLPLRTAYEVQGNGLLGQKTAPALGTEVTPCIGFKVRLFGKIYLNQSVGFGLGFYQHEIQDFDGPLFHQFPQFKGQFIGPICHLGVSRAVDFRRRK